MFCHSSLVLNPDSVLLSFSFSVAQSDSKTFIRLSSGVVSSSVSFLLSGFNKCCFQCFDTVGWVAGQGPACKTHEWQDAGRHAPYKKKSLVFNDMRRESTSQM